MKRLVKVAPKDYSDPVEYFWARVEKGPNCWAWRGSVYRGGYGAFKSGQRAHRVSWVMHNGQIPEGMMVCHHCDNPLCVRPSHLFLGTDHDNVADMIAKGRRRVELRGDRSPRAKLTNDEAEAIRGEYLRGGIGQMPLAKKYHVARGTIQRILNYESYAAEVAA